MRCGAGAVGGLPGAPRCRRPQQPAGGGCRAPLPGVRLPPSAPFESRGWGSAGTSRSWQRGRPGALRAGVGPAGPSGRLQLLPLLRGRSPCRGPRSGPRLAPGLTKMGADGARRGESGVRESALPPTCRLTVLCHREMPPPTPGSLRLSAPERPPCRAQGGWGQAPPAPLTSGRRGQATLCGGVRVWGAERPPWAPPTRCPGCDDHGCPQTRPRQPSRGHTSPNSRRRQHVGTGHSGSAAGFRLHPESHPVPPAACRDSAHRAPPPLLGAAWQFQGSWPPLATPTLRRWPRGPAGSPPWGVEPPETVLGSSAPGRGPVVAPGTSGKGDSRRWARPRRASPGRERRWVTLGRGPTRGTLCCGLAGRSGPGGEAWGWL